MSLLSETLDILDNYGLSSKYNLGQNFLIDQNIIDKIIKFSYITKDDTILEIGPGIGSLTKSLVENAKSVCVVEKDKDMVNILKNRFDIKIINKDAMDVHVEADKLVANLPYNVAAPLIITHVCDVKESYVMVQKEIADRIFAKSGQKIYGAYTVKLAMLAKPVDRFNVSLDNFYPKPRVESSVIKLVTDVSPYAKTVSWIADIVFAHRRKTILNNIKLANKSDDKALINSLSQYLTCRAEELDFDQYIDVAKKYEESLA